MAGIDTFKIATADQSIDIAITEVAVFGENLGLKTWGAAFILANQIHNLEKYILPQDASGRRSLTVLEIGAGTALAGLAAAAIWKSDVIITDLPSIIPGMEANIILNAELLNKSGGRARCGSLDWADPDKLVGDGFEYNLQDDKFQVLLAADTLYSEDHPGLMANTIFRWLARNKNAAFIVCYAQRIAYLDHIRELWTLLEDGGLQSVHEGSERGDASWDEEAPFEWAVFKWKDLLDA